MPILDDFQNEQCITRDYDISSDGQRFATISLAANDDEARSPSAARVIVVQNWIEELKQRVTVE